MTTTQWQTDFCDQPMFGALKPLFWLFKNHKRWPTVADFNHWMLQMKHPAQSELGRLIHFVEQLPQLKMFSGQYEPRIYLNGEVQTRAENWHDFFNALMWMMFPKVKAAMNYHQYQQQKERWGCSSQRSNLENILALFDENGAIVVSSNRLLSRLLREFKWKELFVDRRYDVLEHMQFFMIGHSLYEKALNPYVGMTANSMILEVEESFFNQPLVAQIKELDVIISNMLMNKQWVQSPKAYSPLPLLGIPGWTTDNEQPGYYDNIQYFRKGRSQPQNATLLDPNHLGGTLLLKPVASNP